MTDAQRPRTDRRRPYTASIDMDALVVRADGSTINFGDAIYHPENADEARAYAEAALAAPAGLREALDILEAERERAHNTGEHEYERGLEFMHNPLVAAFEAAPRSPEPPLRAALRGLLRANAKAAGQDPDGISAVIEAESIARRALAASPEPPEPTDGECVCWCHANPEKCAAARWHLHHASPESPEAGIDVLRALSDAATPGPWEAEPLTGDGWAITGDTPEPTDGSDGTWSTDGYGLAVALSREDAKFIPAAVNYVRARLASREEKL